MKKRQCRCGEEKNLIRLWHSPKNEFKKRAYFICPDCLYRKKQLNWFGRLLLKLSGERIDLCLKK